MAADVSTPVFVTGGSGLIGSHLIGHLVRLGYPIRALYRQQVPLIPYRNQVEWVEGDVRDPGMMREAIRGVRYLFHGAAMVSYAPQDDSLLQQINVEGTANVVNACLEADQPVKLCHISSIAAIGRPKGSSEADEEAKWDPAGDHSAYARSKYFGELEVWRGVAEGLEAVIVNPSVVLGPADWSRSSTRLFKYVFDESPFYPKGSANFVDVRDVVEAMVRLMFSDVSGERFILNQGTHSYQNFFRQVADCWGKKPPSVPAPPFLTEAIWRFEHVRSWFTGRRPLITKATARLSGKALRFTNQKIKETLMFEFRPFADSVRWTCEGLLQQRQASEEVPQG